jgi:hypothetical protein
MQQQMQQMMMEQARQTLNITNDDEWAVIQALLQKVSDARRERRRRPWRIWTSNQRRTASPAKGR